ncbi:MAG TPA: dephospho-CoA kinase [Elusimicrobiota bacterium]|nr:dephospho-CoA kinase [Elusimicrobiota bacterium]
MRPKRFVVGLTGGIGTGKSSALAEFERAGASTLSLDQIAHEQAKPGREGYRAIVKAFGKNVVRADGRLDRRGLGEIVFKSPAALRRLEKATHPSILREMERLVGSMEGVVVVDVPLLFEKKLRKHFDATVLISSDLAAQRRRVTKRDGLSPMEARRRMKAQLPLRAKRRLADYAIDNDTTLSQLQVKVRRLHSGLSLLFGGTPNGNSN